MLCLQIKCPCGHFGRVFDQLVVMKWRAGDNPGIRCSLCRGREQLEITRSFYVEVNQMASGYDAVSRGDDE